MLNFIVNLHSLRGKYKKLISQLEERLRANGAKYRFFYSKAPGDCVKFSRCLSEAGETEIIGVGGDGTLNEILCGLYDPSRVHLGLIPAGTGNDFAASAHIPLGADALYCILGKEAVATDFIECDDGDRSLNIAGVGIDVDILERCARKKHGGRKSKYFFSLLASLFHFRGFGADITVNGETTRSNILIAAICNGKQLGGGIPLCPVAEIGDGMMELVVVDCPKRRIQLIKELIYLMRGKLLTRAITHRYPCREAIIKPDGNRVVQYDGELREKDALRATLISGKLHMYRG